MVPMPMRFAPRQCDIERDDPSEGRRYQVSQPLVPDVRERQITFATPHHAHQGSTRKQIKIATGKVLVSVIFRYLSRDVGSKIKY